MPEIGLCLVDKVLEIKAAWGDAIMERRESGARFWSSKISEISSSVVGSLCFCKGVIMLGENIS